MKIVVVGAGAGGLAAATRAKRTNPDARVLVIEKTSEFSRGTCSLPYYLSGELQNRRHLQGVTLEELQAKGVELQLKTEAIRILPHQRKLETSADVHSYDRLIVSTGSRPRSTSLNYDHNAPGIWSLRTLAQVERTLGELKNSSHHTAAIVGGGYVGLEFAEALRILGLQVTIFHRGKTLMRLHPDINNAVCNLLQTHGIDVELSSEVTKIEQGETGFTLEAGGGASQFGAIGMACGIEPETTILTGAGARVGPSGAVLVNARGETTLSNIYACGDGVELPNPEGGPGRWIPLATTAARLGRVCGENAASRGGRRLGSHLGALAVRLFDTQLGVLGQPPDWEDCVEHKFSWGKQAHPFPSRRQGVGVLFVERRTERLRGIQVLGPDAGHIVNLVSLACERGLKLRELQDLDYSYNPPLSGLWHPLYLAAREAERKENLLMEGRF